MDRKGLIFTGCCILIATIAGAWLLGHSLERFRREDRSIAVKGFSEREVKADLVIWAIRLRVASNNLQEGNKSMEDSKNKVNAFLVKNGIKNEEIIQRDLMVADKQANEYGGNNNGEQFRYLIEETIEVRSANVDNVQKVSRMTSELLNAGVALSTKNDWSGTGLRFIFTRLNDVKPTMLKEAIGNARNAAIQFTKESNTHLGKLKQASQGYFSVSDRDASLAGQTDGQAYGAGTSDIYKNVRVVISVEYSIE